jgi:hypothetical protein
MNPPRRWGLWGRDGLKLAAWAMAAALALAPSVGCENSASTHPRFDDEYWGLTGTVRDGPHGFVLAGAAVLITHGSCSDAYGSAQTDSLGAFGLSGLGRNPDPTAALCVSYPGYQTQVVALADASHESGPLWTLDVVLVPAAAQWSPDGEGM